MKLELTPYEHNDLIPNGQVLTFEMEMTPYPDARRRTIRVWLPGDYDGVKRFPVVYMHDGQGLFRAPNGRAAFDVDRILTDLTKEGISAIVVGIDTDMKNRRTELTPPLPRGENPDAVPSKFGLPAFTEASTTDLYADFVIDYLKPAIDENFMTLTDPVNTCVAGASAGGSASFYMMLRNPEIFGRAIVFSPGFPRFPKDLLLKYLDDYDFAKIADHRIAFYNGDQGLDQSSVDHVLAVYRKMREKGLDNQHCMFLLDTRQSHYAAGWSKHLPELLRFVFAADNSQPQNDPMPPRPPMPPKA